MEASPYSGAVGVRWLTAPHRVDACRNIAHGAAADSLLHRLRRRASGVRPARKRTADRQGRHLAYASGVRLGEPGLAPLAGGAGKTTHGHPLRRAWLRALRP